MFVLKVMGGEELTAKKLLEDKGYKILCPRKIKIEQRGNVVREVEKIVFTGYLFLDMFIVSATDYYNIKDTFKVIGFLDSKYNLPIAEEKYIRTLDNDNTPITKIDIYFDMDNKPVLCDEMQYENIKTKNILRINRRNKTITFRFKLYDEERIVTFNYNEITNLNTI